MARDDPPREPIPAHTPIPYNVDQRIDRLALDLANCRNNLTPEGRLRLANWLAFRTRHWIDPKAKK